MKQQQKQLNWRTLMTEAQIGDIWLLFAAYLDNKQQYDAAMQFVEMLGEYGVSDRKLQMVMGIDKILDEAIDAYLNPQEEPDESDLDFE